MALLTQHGKERVIGPRLQDRLSADLVVIGDFDTDTLGTFTRDVPRVGTQLEAARRKAMLACERSGLPYGLGSEGSFNPGPFGFGAWNVEIVVLVDREREIEIVGRASEPGLFHHRTLRTIEELREFATAASFPDHALALRPNDEDDPRVVKGLQTWEALESAFATTLQASSRGEVFVEHDVRAYLHPTRMANIDRAAQDLVTRIETSCPSCGTPGFGRVGVVAGLPCRECGNPTELPVEDEFGCVRCDYRERRPHGDAKFAEPHACPWCNP
jgi:hypothetical protein